MNLDLITLIGMLALSFCSGAWIMHVLKRQKIKKIKEELIAYKRSADGLWELNEQRLKKSKQKKEYAENKKKDYKSRSIFLV